MAPIGQQGISRRSARALFGKQMGMPTSAAIQISRFVFRVAVTPPSIADIRRA
jgi:hypothetical protein